MWTTPQTRFVSNWESLYYNRSFFPESFLSIFGTKTEWNKVIEASFRHTVLGFTRNESTLVLKIRNDKFPLKIHSSDGKFVHGFKKPLWKKFLLQMSFWSKSDRKNNKETVCKSRCNLYQYIKALFAGWSEQRGWFQWWNKTKSWKNKKYKLMFFLTAQCHLYQLMWVFWSQSVFE